MTPVVCDEDFGVSGVTDPGPTPSPTHQSLVSQTEGSAEGGGLSGPLRWTQLLSPA